MINAGRIKHHVFNNIDNPRNTILIVGYCAPGTPGGYLRDGVETLRLFGEWKPVRAKVVIMDSFSAHADRMELLDFVRPQKESLKNLFLVHGTYEKQKSFEGLLRSYGFQHIEIPKLGQEYELG
jgi:metallo-beta-lactamase family protein